MLGLHVFGVGRCCVCEKKEDRQKDTRTFHLGLTFCFCLGRCCLLYCVFALWHPQPIFLCLGLVVHVG